MLHPALGKNRYCGPGALAILFGCSTDEGARLLREVTGRTYIKSANPDAMIQVIHRLGGQAEPALLTRKRLPLREWAKGCAGGRWLVQVTCHYVVVDAAGDTVLVADNQSVTERTVAEFRRGGKHVVAAWMVR